MNKIILKNIQKSFNNIHVLTNINYTFKQGQTYGIMGVSGTGKSTLLHLIAGLDHPDSGSILFETAHSSKNNITEAIGLVFQKPHLIKELSVLENVMIRAALNSTSLDNQENKAIQLLQELGLHDKIYAKPSSLSGGQQQRVALARALIAKPTFLIADEPTAHVDQSTKQELIELILHYHKIYSMGVIISSHDLAIIQIMNNTLTLERGSLV